MSSKSEDNAEVEVDKRNEAPQQVETTQSNNIKDLVPVQKDNPLDEDDVPIDIEEPLEGVDKVEDIKDGDESNYGL